jgi:hypothetical protein
MIIFVYKSGHTHAIVYQVPLKYMMHNIGIYTGVNYLFYSDHLK